MYTTTTAKSTKSLQNFTGGKKNILMITCSCFTHHTHTHTLFLQQTGKNADHLQAAFCHVPLAQKHHKKAKNQCHKGAIVQCTNTNFPDQNWTAREKNSQQERKDGSVVVTCMLMTSSSLSLAVADSSSSLLINHKNWRTALGTLVWWGIHLTVPFNLIQSAPDPYQTSNHCGLLLLWMHTLTSSHFNWWN